MQEPFETHDFKRIRAFKLEQFCWSLGRALSEHVHRVYVTRGGYS